MYREKLVVKMVHLASEALQFASVVPSGRREIWAAYANFCQERAETAIHMSEGQAEQQLKLPSKEFMALFEQFRLRIN